RAIGLDLYRCYERFSGDVSSRALHACVDGNEQVATGGSQEFEAVLGVRSPIGCHITEIERLGIFQDIGAYLGFALPLIRPFVFNRLLWMANRQDKCRYLACESFLCDR